KEILDKFIELGMIIYEDNCIIIKNWCKYQSADKLEEIRKNNRERQRKFRDKTRLKNNVIETLE
ncbi:MAG: phage replisome organizer N-terminal domain-containing protein, partial [Clostridia bacterium]